MEKGKKRMTKTSRQQYEIYLHELENNVTFRENKFTPEDPNNLKEIWDNLVKKLNSSGGAIKDLAAWKRTFSDWKAHVRKRARDIKYSQKATGNIGTPEKSLTDLELRLLQITGTVVVDGIRIPELGITETDIEEMSIEKDIIMEVIAPEPPNKKRGSLIQYVKDIATGMSKTNEPNETNSSSTDMVVILKSIDNKMTQILENQNKLLETLNKN